MDPGRPKQPTALESVVQAHSDQLIKLNTELSSAFAQVTGEMGDLRTSATSTSMALASLSNQVTSLTDLVTRLHPVQTGGAANPAPPVARQPPAPVVGPGGNPPCHLPTPTPESSTYAGVSWGSASCISATNPPAIARTVPA